MSETIEAKFAIGDAVFFASTVIERKQHPCPDCKGSRRWTAKSPAGAAYDFGCPRCSNNYMSNDALSLSYSQHTPVVKRLTIGSIQINTNDDEPNKYMCEETGIGSGSVYRESQLFANKDDAQRASEIDAALRNLKTDWIAKQYDKTLSLSDYEIGNAALKDARDMNNSREVKLQMLFDDLRGAETIEDVRGVIDQFSFDNDNAALETNNE